MLLVQIVRKLSTNFTFHNFLLYVNSEFNHAKHRLKYTIDLKCISWDFKKD